MPKRRSRAEVTGLAPKKSAFTKLSAREPSGWLVAESFAFEADFFGEVLELRPWIIEREDAGPRQYHVRGHRRLHA